MSDLAEEYARAANIPQLAPDRAARLIQHVLRRDDALGQQPTRPVVVRLAAVLLAAQPHGLSSPTALAEAETVAAMPGLGAALLDVQQGLSALAGSSISADHSLMFDSLQRRSVCRILRHLIVEADGLLKHLEAE